MKNTTIAVADARRDFAKVLSKAKRGARIKVTRYQTTLAGIISGADLARLSECDDVLAREPRTVVRRRRRRRAIRVRRPK